MASNPIQKKVRNAGLIGAALTLLVMSAVVGFLLIQLNNIKKEQKAVEESYRKVYTVNQDIKSGQVITEDMLQLSTAQIQHIPNNATSDINQFTYYSLTDSEGNKVHTDAEGMFLLKNSEYIEIYKEGNKYYTYSSAGEKEDIIGIKSDDIYEDDHGLYIVKEAKNKTRLYKESLTDEYYILKVKYDTTSNGKPKREKEYVNILGTPLLAKINMSKNTVLTLSMLSSGTLVTDDIRKQEYNAVVLPVDLTTGDYIDIRLQIPTGQDFIVVSKKAVEIPVINGVDSTNTMWVNLSEDEIVSMSCAIVEAYRINGSKLYATKYSDPGMQEAATPTYPLNAETVALIQSNPNVTTAAQQGLRDRYTEAMVNIRNNHINNELQREDNTVEENVPDKMNESIVKTQEERKKYLESLTSVE